MNLVFFKNLIDYDNIMSVKGGVLSGAVDMGQSLKEFTSKPVNSKYPSNVVFFTDKNLGYFEVEFPNLKVFPLNMENRKYNVLNNEDLKNSFNKYVLSSLRIKNGTVSYFKYMKKPEFKIIIDVLAMGSYFDMLFCCFTVVSNLYLKVAEGVYLDLSNNVYIRARKKDVFEEVQVDNNFFLNNF